MTTKTTGRTPARLMLAVLMLAGPPLNAADLPQTELTVGIHRIEAEVAATPGDRATGLMNRKAMGVAHGMLFVFDRPEAHCMWMKNTLMPLSVAFINDAGQILNIEDMSPQTEDSHCASRPARYALEMNRGWFVAKGIGAGARVSGLEAAAR